MIPTFPRNSKHTININIRRRVVKYWNLGGNLHQFYAPCTCPPEHKTVADEYSRIIIFVASTAFYGPALRLRGNGNTPMINTYKNGIYVQNTPPLPIAYLYRPEGLHFILKRLLPRPDNAKHEPKTSHQTPLKRLFPDAFIFLAQSKTISTSLFSETPYKISIHPTPINVMYIATLSKPHQIQKNQCICNRATELKSFVKPCSVSNRAISNFRNQLPE